VPDSVRDIVRRAMAKMPEERYQSAEEMLQAIEAAVAHAPAQDPQFLHATSTAVVQGFGGRGFGQASPTPGASTRAALSHPTPLNAPAAREPPRRAVLLALAGLVALGAVIFGAARFGSRSANTAEPKSAAGAVASSAAAVAAEQAPIRVGILHSLSGTMAISEKSVVDATLLAIDELNERGGVLGRRIESVVADGRSDWPTFAREAKRLITQEKVAVVFGGWTSASRKTMRPVFEEYDHLLFYPVQYEGLEQSPNIVYTGAAPNQQILPAVKWCTGYLGARKFFLVGSDYVFPRTANAIIRDALAEQKSTVVGEEYLLLGATDASTIVDKIKKAAPDVILNTINGDSNVAFFRTLRAAGITPKKIPTVSFSVGEDELSQITGISLAGDYLAWNYFASIDRPENTAFVRRFQAKYGSYRVTTDPMEAGYFGVHLWALAVAKAGTDDPRAVRHAVHGASYAAPGALVRIDPAN
jgi:urea transport system substrate-binding protein